MGIISQSQQETAAQGQRPGLVAIFLVALAGAAVAITIAWAMFSTAPTVAGPTRTTTQMLQEPGLLDQRRGERGGAGVVVDVPPAGNTLLDPALVEHRRGERGGN